MFVVVISFKYTKNNVGPNILPCGNPVYFCISTYEFTYFDALSSVYKIRSSLSKPKLIVI